MNAVILYRIDGPKRMHRFYRLDVQPDLFGQWCLRANGVASAAPGRRAPCPSLPRRKQRPHYNANAPPKSGAAICSPVGSLSIGSWRLAFPQLNTHLM